MARRGGSRVVSTILVLVGIVLLGVAGYMWWSNMRAYGDIDEVNDRVAEYARLADDERRPPDIDWEGLLAMNPEVVGWINVPNTVVNYPVMQSTDNDKYLSTAPDGSSTIGGSIFVDCECEKPGMVGRNTILYGHHMRNGSQFKVLADMDQQELFDGIDTIWYLTRERTWDLVPVFVYYTTDDDPMTRRFEFEDDADFRRFMRHNLERAVTRRGDADAIVRRASRCLTLSTCNYYEGYGRTEIVCVPRDDVSTGSSVVWK